MSVLALQCRFMEGLISFGKVVMLFEGWEKKGELASENKVEHLFLQ